MNPGVKGLDCQDDRVTHYFPYGTRLVYTLTLGTFYVPEKIMAVLRGVPVSTVSFTMWRICCSTPAARVVSTSATVL